MVHVLQLCDYLYFICFAIIATLNIYIFIYTSLLSDHFLLPTSELAN